MRASSSPASVVLFDLGGVLVRVRGFTNLAALLSRLGVEWAGDGQEIRERWLRSTAVRSFELGQVPPGVFAQRFVEEWHLPIEPAAFAEDVAGWIVGPFPGAQRLIADLQHLRCHVSCFSNCNALHWEQMTSFLGLLDSAYSSHILGLIKPDEEAFAAVAERLGVDPGDIVFFDDSRSNVEAAGRVGMRSFLVDGPDACRAVLESEGLL